jgi:hypothetical protein
MLHDDARKKDVCLWQVPLMGNHEVLAAYQDWEASLADGQDLPPPVEKGYERAQAAVELRRVHEEAVAPHKPPDEGLLAAYMAYINLEEVAPPFWAHLVTCLLGSSAS